MIILLPPSEGKQVPSRGKPLDLQTLSFGELNPLRSRVLKALEGLCRDDPPRAIEALELGPTQFELVANNARLSSAPTAAAYEIYTGVLYAALDHATLSGADLRRANRRLVTVSALFGMVRPRDRICSYRLSGGSRLPTLGGLPALWRPALTQVLAGQSGLIVDMLSSPYASMVGLPRPSVTVKVWQPGPGGQRTAASHFNKATKGHLARTLATSPEDPRTREQLLAAVRDAGWDADLDGARLDVMMRDET